MNAKLDSGSFSLLGSLLALSMLTILAACSTAEPLVLDVSDPHPEKQTIVARVSDADIHDIKMLKPHHELIPIFNDYLTDCLGLLLSVPFGWAEGQVVDVGPPVRTTSLDELESVFFATFPVADQTCPEAFEDAYCYAHGYEGYPSFFEFKRYLARFLGLSPEAPQKEPGVEEVSRWRFTTEPRLGDDAYVFRASYRLLESGEDFEVIYALGMWEPNLLILVPGDE